MDFGDAYEPRARRVPLPTRGGAMAVLDFGPADRPVDIVFSHANGFNGRTYRSILAPLASGLRLLAVDMRGHGVSTLPTPSVGWPGWTAYRDDLLALIEAELTAPAVLCGHSMGGTTSLLAAASAPDSVKALVLFDPVFVSGAPVGPNPLADGAERRRAVFPSKADALQAYTGRGAFRSWSPEQLSDYVEAGFRDTEDGHVTLTCTPAWEASNFRIHNYDIWTAFDETRCPIRMLRAETGSTARIEGREDELRALGRVRFETVPGTTHFLPMERPEVVRAALREAI